MGENKQLFNKFCRLCRRLIPDDDVPHMLLIKRYRRAKKSFVKSEEFANLLKATKRQMFHCDDYYVPLLEVANELKAYKETRKTMRESDSEESEDTRSRHRKKKRHVSESDSDSSSPQPADKHHKRKKRIRKQETSDSSPEVIKVKQPVVRKIKSEQVNVSETTNQSERPESGENIISQEATSGGLPNNLALALAVEKTREALQASTKGDLIDIIASLAAKLGQANPPQETPQIKEEPAENGDSTVQDKNNKKKENTPSKKDNLSEKEQPEESRKSNDKEPQPSTSKKKLRRWERAFRDDQRGRGKQGRKKGSEKQIKKLEKLLHDISDEIKKLEEQELTLEDMKAADTPYLYIDRYKKKFVVVWNKLCEIKGRTPYTGRKIERKFKYEDTRISLEGRTRYPEINRCIERFINKYKEFPDYHDIRDIVTKCNVKYHLKLGRRMVDDLSRDCFTEVGNQLQMRRRDDFIENFGSHLTERIRETDDPALFDKALRRKLEANHLIGTSRLEDVINKFAYWQEEDGDLTTSSDEDDKEKEIEKEEAAVQIIEIEDSDDEYEKVTRHAGKGIDKDSDSSSDEEIVRKAKAHSRKLHRAMQTETSSDSSTDLVRKGKSKSKKHLKKSRKVDTSSDSDSGCEDKYFRDSDKRRKRHSRMSSQQSKSSRLRPSKHKNYYLDVATDSEESDSDEHVNVVQPRRKAKSPTPNSSLNEVHKAPSKNADKQLPHLQTQTPSPKASPPSFFGALGLVRAAPVEKQEEFPRPIEDVPAEQEEEDEDRDSGDGLTDMDNDDEVVIPKSDNDGEGGQSGDGLTDFPDSGEEMFSDEEGWEEQLSGVKQVIMRQTDELENLREALSIAGASSGDNFEDDLEENDQSNPLNNRDDGDVVDVNVEDADKINASREVSENESDTSAHSPGGLMSDNESEDNSVDNTLYDEMDGDVSSPEKSPDSSCLAGDEAKATKVNATTTRKSNDNLGDDLVTSQTDDSDLEMKSGAKDNETKKAERDRAPDNGKCKPTGEWEVSSATGSLDADVERKEKDAALSRGEGKKTSVQVVSEKHKPVILGTIYKANIKDQNKIEIESHLTEGFQDQRLESESSQPKPCSAESETSQSSSSGISTLPDVTEDSPSTEDSDKSVESLSSYDRRKQNKAQTTQVNTETSDSNGRSDNTDSNSHTTSTIDSTEFASGMPSEEDTAQDVATEDATDSAPTTSNETFILDEERLQKAEALLASLTTDRRSLTQEDIDRAVQELLTNLVPRPQPKPKSSDVVEDKTVSKQEREERKRSTECVASTSGEMRREENLEKEHEENPSLDDSIEEAVNVILKVAKPEDKEKKNNSTLSKKTGGNAQKPAGDPMPSDSEYHSVNFVRSQKHADKAKSVTQKSEVASSGIQPVNITPEKVGCIVESQEDINKKQDSIIDDTLNVTIKEEPEDDVGGKQPGSTEQPVNPEEPLLVPKDEPPDEIQNSTLIAVPVKDPDLELFEVKEEEVEVKEEPEDDYQPKNSFEPDNNSSGPETDYEPENDFEDSDYQEPESDYQEPEDGIEGTDSQYQSTLHNGSVRSAGSPGTLEIGTASRVLLETKACIDNITKEAEIVTPKVGGKRPKYRKSDSESDCSVEIVEITGSAKKSLDFSEHLGNNIFSNKYRDAGSRRKRREFENSFDEDGCKIIEDDTGSGVSVVTSTVMDEVSKPYRERSTNSKNVRLLARKNKRRRKSSEECYVVAEVKPTSGDNEIDCHVKSSDDVIVLDVHGENSTSNQNKKKKEGPESDATKNEALQRIVATALANVLTKPDPPPRKKILKLKSSLLCKGKSKDPKRRVTFASNVKNSEAKGPLNKPRLRRSLDSDVIFIGDTFGRRKNRANSWRNFGVRVPRRKKTSFTDVIRSSSIIRSSQDIPFQIPGIKNNDQLRIESVQSLSSGVVVIDKKAHIASALRRARMGKEKEVEPTSTVVDTDDHVISSSGQPPHLGSTIVLSDED